MLFVDAKWIVTAMESPHSLRERLTCELKCNMRGGPVSMLNPHLAIAMGIYGPEPKQTAAIWLRNRKPIKTLRERSAISDNSAHAPQSKSDTGPPPAETHSQNRTSAGESAS